MREAAGVRIVDVCGFYAEQGGGVRSYVRQKLAAAAEHGHHVSVIAPGVADRVERVAGGRVVWLASPAMPFDSRYRRFRDAGPVWRAIDAERPDILEGSSPWRGGWLARDWPGRAPRALIFHQDFVAGYPCTLLDRWLSHAAIDRLFAPWWVRLRRLSEGFDVTVTGGEWIAARLASFGVHRPLAIPFGVEPGRFSPARRDPALRAQMLARCGIGPEGRLLLAVGRFHPEKRWGVILGGFRRAKTVAPDLALIVVGDGLQRSSVERSASRIAGVHLAGLIVDRDRLADLYASADLLVHGSGAETYGLVVAEAIASGLRVVAPDTGGAADLAAASGGSLYVTGDPAGCARAIIEALAAEPPQVRPLMRTSGDTPTHFSRLFSLYADLLAADADVAAAG